MDKLLIVCGPTATGKTKLAVTIAKKIGGELISADSRQIYRGMDIGTGKDLESREVVNNLQVNAQYGGTSYELHAYDMNGVPLWMYDVVNPDSEFSVSHYQTLANVVIESIRKRNRLPIIVGGTGLYIQSILHDIETGYIPPNWFLRRKLSESSTQELQTFLEKENPTVFAALNNSDRMNPRRLIRKIEIARSKKNTAETYQKPKQDTLTIGLTAPSEYLYKQIDERVEKRVAQGIIKEIQALCNKGYTWNLPSFDALGYKQWKPWFDTAVPHTGEAKKKIISEWKYAEHAYARRQMTWFKKQPSINWFDVSGQSQLLEATDTVRAWYNTK